MSKNNGLKELQQQYSELVKNFLTATDLLNKQDALLISIRNNQASTWEEDRKYINETIDQYFKFEE